MHRRELTKFNSKHLMVNFLDENFHAVIKIEDISHYLYHGDVGVTTIVVGFDMKTYWDVDHTIPEVLEIINAS